MDVVDYCRPGLRLRRGGRQRKAFVVALQHHLRALGYLRSGIDGAFGGLTERAVKALQHDLLNNDGRGRDGQAPVSLLDCNGGRIVTVDGMVDHALASIIQELLNNSLVPRLPAAADPVAANREVRRGLTGLASRRAPVPFLYAILKQESGLRHYHVPRGADQDSYITVGLDTRAGAPHVITSRGYGLGQYTLFHHPPHAEEVRKYMTDLRGNLDHSLRLLRDKFDHFVNGATSGTRADDRRAEFGDGPLRLCRYGESDPRYLSDCVACARNAPKDPVVTGTTPLYPGSRHRFQATQYYRKSEYRDVPRRSGLGCDWPYAVRRYNGAGINSYHYQVRILQHLAAG